jgi:hypothetical protein
MTHTVQATNPNFEFESAKVGLSAGGSVEGADQSRVSGVPPAEAATGGKRVRFPRFAATLLQEAGPVYAPTSEI